MAESRVEKPSMNWRAESLSSEWERFEKHFHYYCMGPLSGKSEEVRIGYLLLLVGERGREIHESVNLSEEDKTRLDRNLEVFRNYTAPRKNALRAGFRFDRRRQGENELFDEFVTDLKILVRDCHFVDVDRRLRDAIVYNCYHEKVREKCLDEGDNLTLDKAIGIGQTFEVSKKGLRELSNRGEDASVNAMRQQGRKGYKPYKQPYKQQEKKFSTKETEIQLQIWKERRKMLQMWLPWRKSRMSSSKERV